MTNLENTIHNQAIPLNYFLRIVIYSDKNSKDFKTLVIYRFKKRRQIDSREEEYIDLSSLKLL